MTVTITVREVRDQLFLNSDSRQMLGDGAASTRLLGQMFHDVFAALVTAGSSTHACAALADVEPDQERWRQTLVDHAYRELVGPRLEATAGQLGAFSEETLRFWEAVCELCHWLADILWAVYETQGRIDAAQTFVTCEVPMTLDLHEPGWPDRVVLRGVADAVLKIPDKSSWCVVELKLGQTAPEVDAGQAALYHMMLCAADGHETRDGSLAVISFKPKRAERLFASHELRTVTSRLKDLIGRMAGVAASPNVGRGPQADLLNWGEPTSAHEQMKQDLLRVLKAHRIAAKIDAPPLVGPTFLRFFAQPQAGTRVAAFKGRERDVALGMGLRKEPGIHRVFGKIAIDIERPDRQTVRFGDLRQFLPQSDPLLGNSKLLVGVDLEGNIEFADLAEPEHCHILVAGTTGSGKSQWLRAAIGSLTETNSPESLRLVLIDPKRNAFTAWRDSSHLLRPLVFPDETSPVDVLEQLVEEMEARYRRMEGVDDLRQLMQRDRTREARIVCVCDEYADLVEGNKKQRDEIESLLSRLGAKARAAGIHLILATQRPSRDVVRGTLKANLPARVGLTVASAIEARIIDTPGAENLLNDGDLLFKALGEAKRLQGAFVSADELARIAGKTPAFAVA